jgi:class I fructose-bisphosphate aldolase
MSGWIPELLGPEAGALLKYECKGIPRQSLHLPGPDYVDRVFIPSDRNQRVLNNLARLHGCGRLAGTGYLSILPIDQGIEHSAAASFAPNPIYFDPENIVKLAIEGGCNAVASTFGVLGAVSRKYAHKIPFIVKINHNELLSYPNSYEQILFGVVDRAAELGAAAVGATIYFGSEDSHREIVEVAGAFERAHSLGLATVLWCYLRNSAFKTDKADFHNAADLTAQANHLGVTLLADVIKQKLPTNNGGYTALKFGKTSSLVYDKLTSDNPIDLCRWQVANCYMGRIGLINSGGESKGQGGHQQACRRHGAHQRAQGVPAAHGRGHQAAEHDPGRLPRPAGDGGVTLRAKSRTDIHQEDHHG